MKKLIKKLKELHKDDIILANYELVVRVSTTTTN